jgi:hypothetical protein
MPLVSVHPDSNPHVTSGLPPRAAQKRGVRCVSGERGAKGLPNGTLTSARFTATAGAGNRAGGQARGVPGEPQGEPGGRRRVRSGPADEARVESIRLGKVSRSWTSFAPRRE